jgi:hypothetical protein
MNAVSEHCLYISIALKQWIPTLRYTQRRTTVEVSVRGIEVLKDVVFQGVVLWPLHHLIHGSSPIQLNLSLSRNQPVKLVAEVRRAL